MVKQSGKNIFKKVHSSKIFKDITDQHKKILVVGDKTKTELEQCVDILKVAPSIRVTGCGSSHSAAIFGSYLFSDFTGKTTTVDESSQIKYKSNSLNSGSVLVALSQSGESEDILEAAEIAQQQKSTIISIVNSENSSLEKMSDVTLKLNCGAERGKIATKSFLSQLAIMYKLVDEIVGCGIEPDFKKVSKAIQKILAKKTQIHKIAKKLSQADDIFIIASGLHHPIAKEMEQKFWELAKIPSHAMIPNIILHKAVDSLEPETFAIVFNPKTTKNNLDLLDRVSVLKARGAKIIGISNRKESLYDYWIEIPSVPENLFPLLETIPMQLLTYYTAIEREIDPDRLEKVEKVYSEQLTDSIIGKARKQSKRNTHELAVYVEGTRGNESITYNSNKMESGKIYEIEWSGQRFALVKSKKDKIDFYEIEEND